MVGYMGEGYCENKIDKLDNITNYHNELAVAYDESNWIFFGAMIDGEYEPHFNLPLVIYTQPVHKTVNTFQEAIDLISMLNEVIIGNISEQDFLNSNFESNELISNKIDPEGFVIITEFIDENGKRYFDYEKGKTDYYYKFHKIHLENINYLITLPKSSEKYFPILNKIHLVFDNMNEKINKLISEIVTCINFEIKLSKESIFYIKQPSKAQKHMDSGNVDIIYKMILNTKSLNKELYSIFSKITKDLYNNETEEMCLLVKNIMMKIEPWKINFESRITQMIDSKDKLIINLIGIILT
jgi:hypothetical protein